MEPIVDRTPGARERNNLTIKRPVQGILENIVLESLKQGVNPFAPLAIAHKESGFGTLSSPNNPMQYDHPVTPVGGESIQSAKIRAGVDYFKKHLDLNDGSMWHGLRNYNGAGPRARKYATHVSELVSNLQRNNPHVVDLVNKISRNFYEGLPEVQEIKEGVNPLF